MNNPKIIILISGKRKSGKDYIAEKVLNRISKEFCTIVRISEPIKTYYAKNFNLDLEQLLSEAAYKEKYRLDMINWSEKVRMDDYGYFCEKACENAQIKPVWIVSDIRRKTDLKWFKENYGNAIKTIRIKADQEVRENRGWAFQEGVDNVASECDLDDIKDWDFVFDNNNTEDAQKIIEFICDITKDHL